MKKKLQELAQAKGLDPATFDRLAEALEAAQAASGPKGIDNAGLAELVRLALSGPRKKEPTPVGPHRVFDIPRGTGLSPEAPWLFDTLADTPATAASAAEHLQTSADRADGPQPLPTLERLERARLGPDGRYEMLDEIAKGGMSYVHRVLDKQLNRPVVMKTIQPRLMANDVSTARFVGEAQLTAQLQHPGIVSVLDLGRLSDDRLYFTMEEIRGRTLQAVIKEVHAASDGSRWLPAPSGWTFRRALDAFHRVCETVAYAHERGVVHRDLKPANVMVGEHGETIVIDWGVAKVFDQSARANGLVTDRCGDVRRMTRAGALTGTPAYMAPEQALGLNETVDARTDVYALGSMLYELLSGSPPYSGARVVHQVMVGPPVPAAERTELPLPEELVAILERAMQREPDARYASAQEMASALGAWLDGDQMQVRGLAQVRRAHALGPVAARLRVRASGLRRESEELLTDVPPWAPEDDKMAGWDREDEAMALEHEADLRELEAEQLLQGAFAHAPSLPEAHLALARKHQRVHSDAEAERLDAQRAKAEVLLQHHAMALPRHHPARPQFFTYLKGDGALSLVTDPPGAAVFLEKYEVYRRRLISVPVKALGHTPLHEVPLPMGSYLLRIQAEGYDEVRYPIHIDRLGHWDGIAPGDDTPTAIWLPPKGRLGTDDVYIPAGWHRVGGDPETTRCLSAARIWTDGFLMRRFPVTNADYLAFVNDLFASDREAEALKHVPRERAGGAGERGAMIYGKNASGFLLQADADGDLWDPLWPVLMVDWYSADAYSRWLKDKTGWGWRLPHEVEWEKTARGVDGRFFPWGDFLDPSRACIQDSRPGPSLPVSVESFPLDVSPYGVRGLVGNVCDWVGSPERKPNAYPDGQRLVLESASDGPSHRRALRGGSWSQTLYSVRPAQRAHSGGTGRYAFVGFRCAVSIDDGPRTSHE